MRILNMLEVGQVAGGDWSFGFDLSFLHGEVTGTETIQDIASGAAGVVADAYWTARDATADFYGMIGGLFESGCINGGGGR